ncbi:NAD(P)H-dependent oxidoreductase [Flavobacterium sp. J372]|uniref:NAD(P)H-dependent oxidoreductase n=1 Tax=Flavobacterium sp. J372 TaxID=2898436 RepID=UPI002150DF66|nr:NAD(P)H-dependent oxidoreductase [Flavobacterium sp. J372]MCR5861999.1 NAD(P)H-dependent oxidoreductase [Flavobacterium sp. J372]
MTDYIESLNWRYAVKKYDPARKVSDIDIEKLKEAVQLSVSSMGLQPYKVIIVEDKDVKEKLADAFSGNDKNLAVAASHIFIFANEVNVNEAHIDSYIENIAETRGIAKEDVSGFEASMKGYISSLTEEQKNNWTAKQAYIAMSGLINAAAVLRIDTTPMEGFNAAGVNEILKLEEKGLNAAVITTVGYRADDDASQNLKKVRKPENELFITI